MVLQVVGWLVFSAAALGFAGCSREEAGAGYEGRWLDNRGAVLELTKEGEEIVARIVTPPTMPGELGFKPGDTVFRGRIARDGGLAGEFLAFKNLEASRELQRLGCPEQKAPWVKVSLVHPPGPREKSAATLQGEFRLYYRTETRRAPDPAKLALERLPVKCALITAEAGAGAQVQTEGGGPQIGWFRVGAAGLAARSLPQGLGAGTGVPPGSVAKAPPLQVPSASPRPGTVIATGERGCGCRLLHHRFQPDEGIAAQLLLPASAGEVEHFPIERAELALKATGRDTDLLELVTVTTRADGSEDCRGVHNVWNQDRVQFRWTVIGEGVFQNGLPSAEGEAAVYRAPVLLPGESRTVSIDVEADDPATRIKADDPAVRARVKLELKRDAAEGTGRRNVTSLKVTAVESFPNPTPAAPVQAEGGCDCFVQSTKWLEGAPLKATLRAPAGVCPNALEVLSAQVEDSDDLQVSVSSLHCGGETQTLLDIPDLVEVRDWSVAQGKLEGGSEGREVIYRAHPKGRSDAARVAHVDDASGSQFDDGAKKLEARIGSRAPLRTALVFDGGNAGASYDWRMARYGIETARQMANWLAGKGFAVTRLTTAPAKEDSDAKSPVTVVSYHDQAQRNGFYLTKLREQLAKYAPLPAPGTGGCCDELFLYMSGHGNEQGIDISAVSKADDAVWYNQILWELNALPAWVKATVFLDACGAGGFFTSARIGTKQKGDPAGEPPSNEERVQRFCDGHCGLTVLAAVDRFCWSQSQSLPLATPMFNLSLVDSFTADFFDDAGGIRQKFLKAYRDGVHYGTRSPIGLLFKGVGYASSPPQCFRCPARGPWCSLDTDPAGAEGQCFTYSPRRSLPAWLEDDKLCRQRYEEKRALLDDERRAETASRLGGVDTRRAEAEKRIGATNARVGELAAQARALEADLQRERDPVRSRCDALGNEIENKLGQLAGASARTREELWAVIRALQARWKDCIAQTRRTGPALKEMEDRLQAARKELGRERDALVGIDRESRKAIEDLEKQFAPRFAALDQEFERCRTQSRLRAARR